MSILTWRMLFFSPLLLTPTIWLLLNLERSWYTSTIIIGNFSLNQLGFAVGVALESPKDNCSATGEKLVGALHVNKRLVANIKEIEQDFAVSHGGWVEKGGASRPRHCRPLNKVAIIIPYRERYEQLKLFLRHIHPILQRQLLDYRIFVVEQNGTTLFNRAMLFNIGYKVSRRFNDYDCYIFHDVDLLPENDRNMYNCDHSPRHMCPAVDKFKYRLLYSTIFGGVEAFLKEHFEKINGFSNQFWAWGGEDDDLYIEGFKISRPSLQIGRYQMVQEHHRQEKHNRNKGRTTTLLKKPVNKNNGLKTLKYKLLRTDEHWLYTNLLVEVEQAPNVRKGPSKHSRVRDNLSSNTARKPS